MTIGPYNPEEVRVVHIRNTLDLTRLTVSRGCLGALADRPDIFMESPASVMTFDDSGDLLLSAWSWGPETTQ
jgi:hypothetical protein